MLKKFIVLIMFVMGLTSSVQAADTGNETLGSSYDNLIREKIQKNDKESNDNLASAALEANLPAEDYLKQVTACGIWLKFNPLVQLFGIKNADCINPKFPLFKMQSDLLKNSHSIKVNDFKGIDIVRSDPYNVGNGKMVYSFVGKIIQRLDKNSYLLLGTSNMSGTQVPFYLTNVPDGNYHVGGMYMGYVQKSKPYKYTATDGALQIINAGNKVYGMMNYGF